MSEIILKVEHLKKYYEERRGLFSRKKRINAALDDVPWKSGREALWGWLVSPVRKIHSRKDHAEPDKAVRRQGNI